MSLADTLVAVAHRDATTPPAGWNPEQEWSTTTGEGTVTTPPASTDASVDQALVRAGIDPNTVDVLDHTFKTWQAQTPDGIEHLTSHKFRLRRKSENSVDVHELVQRIHEAVAAPALADARNLPTVFAVGDLQLGKGNGDGSAGIVERFVQSLTNAVARYKETPTEHVLIAFLGDCIEGLVSQSGRNIASNDLTLTEQLRVLRNLMTRAVLAFTEAGATVTVLSVPGNHDQTTRVQEMPGDDSFAVDSLRAVEEAFTLAGRDGVTFLYPNPSELAIAVEVAGVRFLTAHGHQWRTGQHYKWWQGQAFSGQTGHDAQWLLAGHRHHLALDTESDRFFLQVPALESRSDWWRNKTGQVGNPGAVYLLIEADGKPRTIAQV